MNYNKNFSIFLTFDLYRAPKPIKTKSAAKHFDSVPPVKKPRKKKELPSVNGMM